MIKPVVTVMMFHCMHEVPRYFAAHLTVHPSSWSRFSASSAFHKPAPAYHASLSIQHIWLSVWLFWLPVWQSETL